MIQAASRENTFQSYLFGYTLVKNSASQNWNLTPDTHSTGSGFGGTNVKVKSLLVQPEIKIDLNIKTLYYEKSFTLSDDPTSSFFKPQHKGAMR